MSSQPSKRPRTKSSSGRRKDIYKKSKYYQEKKQKLLIAAGIGAFVLVFILILASIRGCSNYMSSRQAAAKNTVSMNPSKDSKGCTLSKPLVQHRTQHREPSLSGKQRHSQWY